MVLARALDVWFPDTHSQLSSASRTYYTVSTPENDSAASRATTYYSACSRRSSYVPDSGVSGSRSPSIRSDQANITTVASFLPACHTERHSLPPLGQFGSEHLPSLVPEGLSCHQLRASLPQCEPPLRFNQCPNSTGYRPSEDSTSATATDHVTRKSLQDGVRLTFSGKTAPFPPGMARATLWPTSNTTESSKKNYQCNVPLYTPSTLLGSSAQCCVTRADQPPQLTKVSQPTKLYSESQHYFSQHHEKLFHPRSPSSLSLSCRSQQETKPARNTTVSSPGHAAMQASVAPFTGVDIQEQKMYCLSKSPPLKTPHGSMIHGLIPLSTSHLVCSDTDTAPRPPNCPACTVRWRSSEKPYEDIRADAVPLRARCTTYPDRLNQPLVHHSVDVTFCRKEGTRRRPNCSPCRLQHQNEKRPFCGSKPRNLTFCNRYCSSLCLLLSYCTACFTM